mmetsp:Transcript_30958/g.90525  ORF Transcript_30958/g.90525 Transcript_30958/m.90525 type:complete len:555 (+) Transcript_30958:241-1905(+)
MGCFGNSGAAAQREADHLALINRYKAEITSLKADVARLEREMTELRSQSAEAVLQKEEEAAMVRREMTALRSQLGQATDKEGEVAEHTVSLIQEIAELKGRLRTSTGGAGVDVGSGGGAADSSNEVSRLRRELEEAKEEARSYSEEIGDLARQISDFQTKHVETESYRKEIKYLRSKLGSSDAGSPDSMSCSSADGGGGGGGSSSGDGASDLFGFKGDLLGSSSSYGGGASLSASSSLNSSPIKSARGTFSIDSKNVIQTVSLTSGFFGGKSSSIASDASVTLGDGSSKRSAGSIRSSSAHTLKASVVTPREGGALPANIDAEVVSNAIKCVEDLIKRVNQSRSKGSSLSAGTTGRRLRSFEDGVEVFDLPDSMRGTFDDDVAADCSMSTATGASRQVPRDGDSSEQNSSFYSAASTKEGAASSPMKKKASSTRSPRSPGASSGSVIIDTSSWKPVGTTGELLAVSDDGSTIGTLEAGDEYGLDDSGSLYSAYSAPLLTGSARKASRNESAVIIADLYRVQNLLSSVLEGRPHVKEQLQSSLLQPHSFARSDSR